MAVTSPAPDITSVAIEEEMRRSYLDYAMSVIVARAIPDVRDGLKPVHRRILYSMKAQGNEWNRPYRKSARIVGEVMGKYHPHGDLAIYEAMVRMAQDFAMRLPLVDGQGNFGSMDGDPPAHQRYTEARLARAADTLLDDLDKDTVDFQPNYDETEREPKVLPAGFPNLLVNGGSGIAVGMATNIPPHNLGEVIDACCAYLDNREIIADELMEYLPAPDFPTGGIIVGRAGTAAAYKLGRGAIILRARHHIEELRRDRQALVFTEIPYQVNKARLVERIAETVREKLIEGIAEMRDESDREGVRVVVELKRDAEPDVVLNQLYRHTALQTSFGVNMLALNAGRPELLTLRDIVAAFIAFREEVITRRTRYLLGKARARAHVLIGLLVAVANIDAVIALIRAAADPASARAALVERVWPAATVAPLIARAGGEAAGGVSEEGTYRLSEEQARAILELRLQRLTGLERGKIGDELEALAAEIGGYLEILGSRDRLIGLLRDELLAIKKDFATPRQTAIEDVEFEADIEALIQREPMVVTVSHNGYIKRVPLSTYRAQRRGGRGRAGMAMREEDFLSEVFIASTHAPVLFFTSSGRVYKLKVYRLPLGTPQARGRPMVNLLPNLAPGEGISAVMALPEDEETWNDLSVMFATQKGYVRRNALSDFGNVMANGKIAMKFEGEEAGDRLIGVRSCSEGSDVLLATRGGKAIRFAVSGVRLFSGRYSVGVRGIRLAEGDEVISMSILRHEEVPSDLRDAYLRAAARKRRQMDAESETAALAAPEPEEAEEEPQGEEISDEVYGDLASREEFLLSVTEKGFGVRSSAYDYRITGRGGQGIDNMDLGRRADAMVAVFPVGHEDEIVLVTDGGQVIRCPVHDIRIARRKSGGVVLFKVGEGERVVSVARLVSEENGNGAAGEPEASAPPEGNDDAERDEQEEGEN